MSEKRSRNQLSPQENKEPESKSQKFKMGEHEAIRQMFNDINSKMDYMHKSFDEKMQTLVTGFDEKMQTLVTRQDIQAYHEEVNMVKVDTSEIKKTLTDIRKEMVEDKKKIQFMERTLREKNIIVKGPFSLGNKSQEIRDLFSNKLKISMELEIDEIIEIGKKGDKFAMVLVQFLRRSSVQVVFDRTKLLAGTEWRIERDYSPEVRKQMKSLLKIKKAIVENIVAPNDKKIRIKVNGEQMKISNNKFYLRDNYLMCGAEPGYMKLNEIFSNCNFNACSFSNLENVNQAL